MDLSGFGSIVSSFINMQSAHRTAEINRLTQEETNIANAELMRELNEKNHQYALEQNEWNKNEWQREFDVQNEYNTPAAKLQRLVSAGLNPNFYSLDGVANAASPGMVQSSDLSNQSTYGLNPNQAYLQDPNYLGGSLNLLSQGLTQMAERALKVRQLEQEQQRIDQNAPLIQAQVDNYLANTNKTKEETENTKALRNEIAERVVLLHNQGEQMAQLAKLAGIDVQKAEIDLDYYRENVATDLELKLKDLGIKDAQVKNLGQEYWKLINETALTGKELDLKDLLIKAAERDPSLKDAELELLKEKINNEDGRKWRELLSGAGGWISGAAVGFSARALTNWFQKSKIKPTNRGFKVEAQARETAEAIDDIIAESEKGARKEAFKRPFKKMAQEGAQVVSKMQKGGKDAVVAFKSFVSRYGPKAGKSLLKFAGKVGVGMSIITLLEADTELNKDKIKNAVERRNRPTPLSNDSIQKMPDAFVNPASWNE